jgi:hypothetical protein
VPRLSHSSRFDHPNNIWWWVQVIKFKLRTDICLNHFQSSIKWGQMLLRNVEKITLQGAKNPEDDYQMWWFNDERPQLVCATPILIHHSSQSYFLPLNTYLAEKYLSSDSTTSSCSTVIKKCIWINVIKYRRLIKNCES